uniref:Uncharacterized protein n=1 Tax=Oryza meridionalis TaxID=40149 RepID=A0A0E0DZG9_9ORYZ
MGAEITAVPNISEGLAEISKKMMDLAAQLRALAAQSAEQAMPIGAAERSDRWAVTFLRPRQHGFKRRLRSTKHHLSQPKVAAPRRYLLALLPTPAESRFGGVVLGMASMAPPLPKPPASIMVKPQCWACRWRPQQRQRRWWISLLRRFAGARQASVFWAQASGTDGAAQPLGRVCAARFAGAKGGCDTRTSLAEARRWRRSRWARALARETCGSIIVASLLVAWPREGKEDRVFVPFQLGCLV